MGPAPGRERPGAFRKLIGHIEPRNITEFSYRIGDPELASIYLSFQAAGQTSDSRVHDADSVVSSMRAGGLEVTDLRGNELAKAHLRHLGGGRADVPHEQLIRFEFPEQPGALVHFLDALGNTGWNVSLFHYRNHGADIGRVLVGVQVPPDEVPQHRAFLDRLGYVYHPETDNPVYAQFMR